MSCSSVWDGVDFSQCFREKYLDNSPLVLTALGAVIVVLSCRKRPFQNFCTGDLVSPNGDNVSRLEADVLMASVAETILPPIDRVVEAAEPAPLPPKEADKIVNDFRRTTTKSSRNWDFVYRSASVIGAAAWCIAQGAAVTWSKEDGRTLVFPVFVFIASLVALRHPGLPILPLVTLDLIPALLLFRSDAIRGASRLVLAPTCVQLVYWCTLMCIPYYDKLDRILDGAVSHGGIDAPPLARHIEEPTSAMSRGTYWFIIPFLWKYYWRPIKLEEIPAIREDDGAAASLGSFRKFQAAQDTKYAKKHDGGIRRRKLSRDLIAFFWPQLVAQVCWALLFTVLEYLPPLGLRLLLRFITERETHKLPDHMAYIYIFMMVLGQSVGFAVYGQALMIGRRICIRMRALIVGEVFTKALRREDRSGTVKKAQVGKATGDSSEAEGAEQSSTDGRIANLVSVDAFLISEVCAYSFYIVSTPVAIVLNVALLYHTLGQSAIAGIAMLILLIPAQTIMAKLMTVYQHKLLSATDKRLEDATEVINFIKLLKFNSWQDKFYERMKVSRRSELFALSKLFALTVAGQVLAWGTPVLVTGAAFGWQVLVVKEPLTAEIAWASLILLNMLRDPVAILQDTITQFVRAYTSCNRVQDFLDEPETLKYKQLSKPGPSDPTIGFRDAIFAYPTMENESAQTEEGEVDDVQPFRLGQLDLNFPTGKLSLITGPVGSGKSTLILSLLGETVLLQGKVFMPDDHANRDICPVDPQTGLADTVAYCAQTPWLVGASIRDNITFGAPWDRSRYNKVVDYCALRRDFEIFELGDLTEVGEKGTTCSGGQKARIALARALYSSSKTVILDDVLSAVDAQTARHIYKNVLQGSLMKGRTCILVTHAVSLCLPAAAFVVMLDDGQVAASGTPSELAASGTLSVEDLVDSAADDEAEEAPQAGTSAFSRLTATIEDDLDGENHDVLVAKKTADADKAAELENKKLVQAETSSQGAMSLRTYLLYFKSMGGAPFWLLALTALIGTQVLQVLTNAWVRDWTNANDPSQRIQSLKTWAKSFSGSSGGHSTTYFMVGYLLISALYLVGVAARVAITCWGSLRASSRLYRGMVKRLLRATLRFFDSTPSGRIINRLSRDMVSIDQQSAEIMTNFINCVLSCAAVLAVVTYSTPSFIFSLVIILVLYYMVGSLYVTTNREIKRFDSVTRSPIFQSFSEALTGSSTIRAYSDSARFIRKLLAENDTNTRCFWYLWQTNRVLNNLSNFVGSLITVSACVLALHSPTMSAGDAGFSISYALSFTDYVLWVVRMYAAAEMSMNSVERVSEYLDLEVEEEDSKRGVEPPAYWPSKDGSVVVSNLTCKYAPQLDPVLKDVSFTIGPNEKIGICGRTGSGKSTLALSFFRFLYQEGGSITIDGQDISELSLATLRSRLTILPQEAQLYSGSLRDNLDPFMQHEDVEIWEALRQCGLAGRTSTNTSRAASRSQSRVASVVNLDQLRMSGADDPEPEERVAIRSLDDPVAAGGKNFSQGQRQLLALARGLLKLRTSSFLIMDESTANLDHATDATIQNVLRTSLEDTQMLVIAHRLMTVCGLDKILVLDHGRVVEFGTPWDLLQDESGIFRDLCRQSGEESQLFELAKSVHQRKTRKALGSMI